MSVRVERLRSFFVLACLHVVVALCLHPVMPLELPSLYFNDQVLHSKLQSKEGEKGEDVQRADFRTNGSLPALLPKEHTRREQSQAFLRQRMHLIGKFNTIRVANPAQEQGRMREAGKHLHSKIAVLQLQGITSTAALLEAQLDGGINGQSADLGAPSGKLEGAPRSERYDENKQRQGAAQDEYQRQSDKKLFLTGYEGVVAHSRSTVLNSISGGGRDTLRSVRKRRRLLRQTFAKRQLFSMPSALETRAIQLAYESASEFTVEPISVFRQWKQGKGASETPIANTKESSSKTRSFQAEMAAASELTGEKSGNDLILEEHELLEWQTRQAVSRQIGANREVNRTEYDDPPPDPTEQRLLINTSERSFAVTAIDFGHDLSLDSKEKEELNRRVEQELARIPRVSHFLPSEKGLLFVDTFERPNLFTSWVVSTSRTHPGQWKHALRVPEAIEGDHGLMALSRGFRHAISRLLPSSALPSSKSPLVLQYELQQQHPDFECGGGYLTFFFSENTKALYSFNGETPYAFRFGADQCGLRREIILKIQRISPLTNERIEHSLSPPLWLPYSDRTRLLTLIFKPEGTFKILLNGRTTREGTILEGLRPHWPKPTQRLQELPEDLMRFNSVGLVFMAMDSGTLVDNIIVSNDIMAAQMFARETFWKRTQVEHDIAESALRTRSAVRKEIRLRRQQAEALRAVSGAPTTPTHSKEGQLTPNRHVKQSKESESPSQVTRITPTRVSSDTKSKRATGEAKRLASCRASWFANDASLDALLNGMIAFSSLLAT